jgi:hypothetical protein
MMLWVCAPPSLQLPKSDTVPVICCAGAVMTWVVPTITVCVKAPDGAVSSSAGVAPGTLGLQREGGGLRVDINAAGGAEVAGVGHMTNSLACTRHRQRLTTAA